MKKPASLRKHLEQYVPWLKKHPEKLTPRIVNGHISTMNGSSLSYEWRYSLELLVMDVTDPPDSLVVPILVWIAENQPDLYEKLSKILTFEVDEIDHGTIDLLFKLDLTESVVVKKVDGGYRCVHPDEPPQNLFDGDFGWQTLGHAPGQIG